MSIRSLAALAVARDEAPPGTPAGGGAGQAAVVTALTGRLPVTSKTEQKYVDVLTSAIPTEPLAAYTTVLSVAAGLISAHPRQYLPFRWVALGAFVAVTALAVVAAYFQASKSTDAERRHLPVLELLSATLAAAAWGAAMPGGPLNAQVTGKAGTLTSISVIVGTATVLALIAAPKLKVGSRTTP